MKPECLRGGRSRPDQLLFSPADTHIRYLSNVREWQRWEKRCFEMLNGDRFRANISDARTVVLDKLPGRSLWDYMNGRTLTHGMLRAAAREYPGLIECLFLGSSAVGRTATLR